MAFTWALDTLQYDLVINRGGKLQTVYGVEEVRQRIVVTLNHFWAEYFLATDHGMPWYEVMLGSRDFNMVETLIRNAVLGVPGVMSLASVSVDRPTYANSRKLSIQIKAEVEGQTSPQLVEVVHDLVTYTRPEAGIVYTLYVIDELWGAVTDEDESPIIGE